MINPRQTWAHDSTRAGVDHPRLGQLARHVARATGERLAEPVHLGAKARIDRPEADRINKPRPVGVVHHEVEVDLEDRFEEAERVCGRLRTRRPTRRAASRAMGRVRIASPSPCFDPKW